MYKFISLCLILLFTYTDGFGQQEQVAFIPGLFEINAPLRKKYNLLPVHADGFQKARLLRDEEGRYNLEISFSKRGRDWQEVYPLKADELEELRQTLNQLYKEDDQGLSVKENNGRTYLITSATLTSIPQSIFISKLFSETIDYGFGWTYEERTRFGRLLPYAGVAGAFLSSALLTRDKYISPAAANMYTFSSLNGVLHGMAINSLVTQGGDIFYDDIKLNAIIGITSLAEGWIMYGVAKKHRFTYARSMAWTSGNFWGTVGGPLFYGTISNFDIAGETDFNFSVLAGSVLGTWLFDHLHKVSPRTPGDYRAINSGMVAGGLLGLYLGAESNYERVWYAAPLVSSALSLIATRKITSVNPLGNLEGSMIALGTFSGSMLGIGLSVSLDFYEEETILLTALGAISGWAASYLIFRDKNKRGTIGLNRKKNHSIFDFGVQPAGLVFSSMNREQQANMLRSNIAPGLVNCSLRF
jgi:hypothetical protein